MSDVLAIGGHTGLEALRLGRGVIRKVADAEAAVGLSMEATMLTAVAGTGIAPRLLRSIVLADGGMILDEEDVGAYDLRAALQQNLVVVEDGEAFRRNCARLLWELRRRRIRHGDPTPPNVVVTSGDRPVLVDWQKSRAFDAPYADRRTSDSWLLWRTAAAVPSRLHPAPDASRTIRRWQMIAGDLGGNDGASNLEGLRLLDLGCNEGDFCAMAAADGMQAVGVDISREAVDAANGHWAGSQMPVEFYQADAADILGPDIERHDAVLLLSTWPYIVGQRGVEAADELLARIVKNTGVLYFETQLAGDGPGPTFLVEDADVLGHLSQFGVVRHLGTIPVTGRAASRSIWKVTKGS